MNPPRSELIPHFRRDAERASADQDREIFFEHASKRSVGDWGCLTAPSASRHEQALGFLLALTSELPSHWLFELRALRREPKRVLRAWYRFDAIEHAARWCLARAAQGFDVYGGVQPRHEHGGGGSAIAALTALYADLDCGQAKRLENKSAALNKLSSLALLGLGPSVLVDSGNGFHAYWPLREPLAAEDRRDWQHAMRALADSVDADPSVTDLPRILRVPGTINWKRADEPRPVELVHTDTRRFTLLDFDELLPALPKLAEPRSVYVPVTIAGGRVLAAIRAAGWRIHEKRDSAGKLVALVLDEPCPFCPGRPVQADAPRRGSAHVAPTSGAFRCKRALCRAGAEATGQTADGEPLGLALDRWATQVSPSAAATVQRSTPSPAFTLPSPARLPTLRRLAR